MKKQISIEIVTCVVPFSVIIGDKIMILNDKCLGIWETDQSTRVDKPSVSKVNRPYNSRILDSRKIKPQVVKILKETQGPINAKTIGDIIGYHSKDRDKRVLIGMVLQNMVNSGEVIKTGKVSSTVYKIKTMPKTTNTDTKDVNNVSTT